MKSQIRIRMLAAVALSMAACAKTSTAPNNAARSSPPQFMFVQSAEDIKVDPAKTTFRLVKVNQQTLYFTDRPQRITSRCLTISLNGPELQA